MKIISLLPSATEIVCALGLEQSLVGVTHECDFPPSVQSLPKATRTIIPHSATSAEIDALVREQLQTQTALYSLDMAALERLAPDLLVTQALCDVCAVAEAEVTQAACRLPNRPQVLNLEPLSLEDVFATLLMVGAATGTDAKAESVVAHLRERVWAVEQAVQAAPPPVRPRVAFLEWIDPLFCGGHWNPALVEMAGGVDVLGRAGERSRTVSWRQVVESQPDVLLIACCGYSIARSLEDVPILQNLPGWNDLPCVRAGRVYVTDGNAYFSRPGPRLADGLELLAQMLHPALFPQFAGRYPICRVDERASGKRVSAREPAAPVGWIETQKTTVEVAHAGH